MLICRNAEGVHGQRKVGNPCLRETRDLLPEQIRQRQVDKTAIGLYTK